MEIKLIFDDETKAILKRIATALESSKGAPVVNTPKGITRDDIVKTAQNIIMSGKENEIKELCKKYDVSRISLISEDKYEDLMKDFENIM